MFTIPVLCIHFKRVDMCVCYTRVFLPAELSLFLRTRAADGQVQREAQTAPDPLGGHGLRGRGRDVAHRASLPEPSPGRVVKGGGARHVQKPRGANKPAACAHSQPGQRVLKNLNTDMFFLNQASRGQPLTLAAASWVARFCGSVRQHQVQPSLLAQFRKCGRKTQKLLIASYIINKN